MSDQDSGSSWDPLLADQLRYYRARAQEYDEWFERLGRYDRGPAENAQWFAEVAEVRRALNERHPGGDVLELAAGTGLWSGEILPRAATLTVVDGAPEMLALHEARLPDPRVRRIHADLFQWTPDRRFDWVVFCFWLSHVPAPLVADFFTRVGRALRPGGSFFFVDSLYTDVSTAKDHTLRPRTHDIQRRRLNDGREFEIVKRFPTPEELTQDLLRLGWSADVRATERFFLYGWGRRDP